MSSEDTAVNVKGTFAVKVRANNGLNRVAAYLNDNRMARVPIVGYVEFLRVVETTDGDTLTVDLIAVEPAIAADGTDVKGWGRQTFRTLDEIRVAHGKGRVADTLFVNGQAAELDGQLEAITRDEVDGDDIVAASSPGRLNGVVNASGEPVDPPSPAELAAEKREAAGDEKTEGQKAFEKDVVAGMAGDNVKPIRAARAPRQRPAAGDPFKTSETPK